MECPPPSTIEISIVLGGGHSIGVPIAVSCDYSYIAETATMTIHPVRLTGLVIGVPQTFEYLDKMQERVVKFVTSHSNITEEKFKELMFSKGNLTRDIGTNVVGKDAVKYGLPLYSICSCALVSWFCSANTISCGITV